MFEVNRKTHGQTKALRTRSKTTWNFKKVNLVIVTVFLKYTSVIPG